MIGENLARVRERIAKAAQSVGRNPQDIKLVVVTKEASAEQISEAIACGVTDIGENRIQDAVAKKKLLRFTLHASRFTIKWHLIGHLQTNKARKAVEIFDLIHSVDSLRLAEVISKEAQKLNKTQGILIQINTSGEETKFGAAPDEAEGLIEKVLALNNINILGLMTIAPFVDNPEDARPAFRRLKELGEGFKGFSCFTLHASRFTELSMGMSNDFEVAIQEGATIVRVGSAIFK